MSTNLNQRKKRGGAVWTEEFYTKGKKLGQKVPGFGMSKAQFTKEGVPRKARKTRSKIGEVDKEAKEKEWVQKLGWDKDAVYDNTASVGNSNRGLHLQFAPPNQKSGGGVPSRRGGVGYDNEEEDYGKSKIEGLGLTKRGKIRVQATGNRPVGKGSKGGKGKRRIDIPHPDEIARNNAMVYTEQSSGLLEHLQVSPPPENHNPLLASLNIPQNVAPTPVNQAINATATKKKKRKFKINKRATPTPKKKPAIGPKPKVKKIFKKVNGKFTAKYKVGNTTF